MATLARPSRDICMLRLPPPPPPRFASRMNEQSKCQKTFGFWAFTSAGLSIRSVHPSPAPLCSSVRPRPPSRSPYYFYHISRLQKFSFLYLSGERAVCRLSGDHNITLREMPPLSPDSVPSILQLISFRALLFHATPV